MKKILSVILAVVMIAASFTVCALQTASNAEDGVISLGKKAILHAKNAKTDTEYVDKNLPALTDGKTADNWAYGDFGEMYAQIDLGRVCTVSGVNVQAYNPYNHAWSVYLSTDGESFTLAATVERTAIPAEGITSELSAQARYVRVYADYYVTANQFSFREVTVCGAEPENIVDPVVSLGKSAFMHTKNSKTETEYFDKNTPGLTDGNTGDNWAWGSFGEIYAQIDLEAEYLVTSVNVIGYAPYKHGWTVFVSTDGQTFAETAGVSAIDHPAEGVTVYFDPAAARYVRVVADYYVTSEQFSFREVTVRGTLPPAPLYPYGGEMTVTLPDGSAVSSLTNGVYDDYTAIAGAVGGYTTIDLKAIVPVDTVAVYAYENNSAYAVYGSADGVDWSFIGYKEQNTASNTSNGWENVFETDGSFRYIRVQWAESGRSDGYLTLKEVDISFGGSEYSDVTVTNVKNVYNNSNADDGNYGNYCFYKKADGYVTVDLGEVKDVRKIAAFTPTGGYGVLAEYSTDGSAWRLFGREAMIPDYDPAVGFVFTAETTQSRYLRFSCFGSESGALDLSEIVLYTPDHTHLFDEGAVTRKATADTEGVRTFTCSICGESVEEAIPCPSFGFTEAPIVAVNGDGTESITIVGTFFGDLVNEIDGESIEKLDVTLVFAFAGTSRSFNVAVRGVYTTVNGVATVAPDSASAQGLMLVEADYIYAIVVRGVPADAAYTVNVSVAVPGTNAGAQAEYSVPAV